MPEGGADRPAEGQFITLFPPLVIDEPTAAEGPDILEHCAAA